MSMFYGIGYRIGFTPWEGGLAQGPAAKQISAMFDREEVGRQPPNGSGAQLRGTGRQRPLRHPS